MNFVVKTMNDRYFGPFRSADDAVKWATDALPVSTQWVVVPVWSKEVKH